MPTWNAPKGKLENKKKYSFRWKWKGKEEKKSEEEDEMEKEEGKKPKDGYIKRYLFIWEMAAASFPLCFESTGRQVAVPSHNQIWLPLEILYFYFNY